MRKAEKSVIINFVLLKESYLPQCTSLEIEGIFLKERKSILKFKEMSDLLMKTVEGTDHHNISCLVCFLNV